MASLGSFLLLASFVASSYAAVVSVVGARRRSRRLIESGLDGSIMFWVFLLSVFGTIAVYVNRERYRELIPYVVATISVVQMFFLYLMVIHKNPFSTFLTAAPAEGNGLSPLLQNFYMAIHPPSLYTGFVGMTIPFAFCIDALITGHLDDSWLRDVRGWTMFAWLFLSIG